MRPSNGKRFQILSLGAGIQSSTILLMSDRGMLPKLDCAIFADTGWELQAVYDQLAWLEREVKIPIHRVSCGRTVREDAVVSQKRGGKSGGGQRFASMPLYTLSPSGKKGMLRRQCTQEFKINPIESFIRKEFLGLSKRQHAPDHAVVDEWLGISTDEAHRMKSTDLEWMYLVYPLLNFPHDFLDHTWSRLDCIEWLLAEYPSRRFVRSACIGCPFKSDDEWLNLKKSPNEWKDALKVDRIMRQCEGMDSEVFLHRKLQPLSEVSLTNNSTGSWGNECAGVCGV